MKRTAVTQTAQLPGNLWYWPIIFSACVHNAYFNIGLNIWVLLYSTPTHLAGNFSFDFSNDYVQNDLSKFQTEFGAFVRKFYRASAHVNFGGFFCRLSSIISAFLLHMLKSFIIGHAAIFPVFFMLNKTLLFEVCAGVQLSDHVVRVLFVIFDEVILQTLSQYPWTTQ